jgi:creatinine amidohydrolase
MSIYFGDQSWPQLKDAIEKDTLILLPIGTTEEHGYHLPVETDAIIAREIAALIGEELKNSIPILIAQTLCYGYSMKEMTRWPGTIRIRTRVVMDTVFDIVSSFISMGFMKIILIDAHGHHQGLLKTVTREIYDEHDVAVAVTSPAVFSKDIFAKVRKTERGGSIHGGEWETSLLMYLKPELVNMKKSVSEDTMKYHSDYVAGDNFVDGQKVTWSTWKIQRSKTGIYGDPTPATSETGRACIDGILKHYKKFLMEYYNNS